MAHFLKITELNQTKWNYYLFAIYSRSRSAWKFSAHPILLSQSHGYVPLRPKPARARIWGYLYPVRDCYRLSSNFTDYYRLCFFSSLLPHIHCGGKVCALQCTGIPLGGAVPPVFCSRLTVSLCWMIGYGRWMDIPHLYWNSVPRSQGQKGSEQEIKIKQQRYLTYYRILLASWFFFLSS